MFVMSNLSKYFSSSIFILYIFIIFLKKMKYFFKENEVYYIYS